MSRYGGVSSKAVTACFLKKIAIFGHTAVDVRAHYTPPHTKRVPTATQRAGQVTYIHPGWGWRLNGRLG